MFAAFRLIILIGIVFTSSILNAFGGEMKKTTVKTFPMEFGGQISIKGDEGFIKIKSWDKSEVQLTMTKRARGRTDKESEQILEHMQVDIESFNDRLVIKVIPLREDRNHSLWDLLDPDTWGRSIRSARVDFELYVPNEINLSLINDEGDVEVESINGDVDIDVDEGDILLKDIVFKTMKLHADEGEINGHNLTNSGGRLTIDVDEGDVMVEKLSVQRFKLDCDEGNVSLRTLQCKTCNIRTDEGDVDIEPILGDNDRYYITADEGDISFYLPSQPNVSLDLETEDGRIRSDFDLNIKRKNNRQQCRQELGTGGNILEIYTDDGNIYIRTK